MSHSLLGVLVATTTFTGLELAVLLSGISGPAPDQIGWVEVAALCGHALGFFVVCGGALALVRLLHQRFAARRARGAWWSAVALTLALCPYFLFLAHYALSGPAIRSIAHRPLLIAAVALVLSCTGVVASRVIVGRLVALRASLWLVVSELVLAAVLVWANSAFLADEYEPLHAFLTLLGIVTVSLLGWEVARLRPFAVRPRMLSALSALLALLAIGGQFALFRSEAARWFVYGTSPASRYAALDLTWEGASGDGATAPGGAPEKPHFVESAQSARERAERKRKVPPHVVVFSIDNLQADRVGANGYTENPSTPNIDRLAKSGAHFTNAYSYFPGTRVFLSSMLLGRRLPNFGAHHMPADYQEQAFTRVLKQLEYHVLVMGVFELTAARRFDPTDYSIDTNLRRATAEEIRKSGTIPHIPYKERFRDIRRHLEQSKAQDRPTFLWLHWLKPHRFRGSFVGSKDFDFGKDIDALYDASVADTDALIPRIEKMMKKTLGSDREILWVIMSDHGAGLTRGNKKETGKTLYEDQVHVPLILSGAGVPKGTYEILVDSAVDTPATILDWVGIKPPASYDGVSLVPILDGTASPDAFDDRLIALHMKDWTGAVHRDHKLIVRKGAKTLYDLKADPREKKNRADSKRALLKTMYERSSAELERNRQLYQAGMNGDGAKGAVPKSGAHD